jgi:CubicO group peptidase (beta-lactamase class C family)
MNLRHSPRALAIALLALACRAPAQIPSSPDIALVPEAELAARGLDAPRVRGALTSVLTRAYRDSAFPGAVAIVGTRSGVVASAAVGRIDWATGAAAVDVGTMWDLASLTKVIGLTSALMQLVAAGSVDLDAPAQRYVPAFAGAGKERVRVADLLSHASGLPAWRPLYKESENREAAIHLALTTPLDVPPGTRMVYSDLGAIVLGQVVERVTGRSFDAYLQERLFKPLGMQHTLFRPPRGMLGHIAFTEVDPWRGRHLHGEVHDENAARLDGVSSHAGLFASAADLSRFARMLLGFGTFEGVRVLDSATIVRFTRTYDRRLSPRGLGWETATGTNSGGRKLSPRAFGHTGFTGTSLWVDPERDLFVILLTNRVNPTRENRKIGDVRIALADAVVDAWGR